MIQIASPEILPIGTQYKSHGTTYELTEASARKQFGTYAGVARKEVHGDRRSWPRPSHDCDLVIDPGSIVLPECAACGDPDAPVIGGGFADPPYNVITGAALCRLCGNSSSGAVCVAISVRRASKLDSVAKPPSNPGTRALDEPGSDLDWSEEVCASCSEYATHFTEQRCMLAGNGRWYCSGCIGGARERHGFPTEQSVTTCSECKAPAIALESGMCGYCAHSTWKGNFSRLDRDAQMRFGTDVAQRDGGAAARRAAWSLTEQARQNPKERAELAKPHPWEMFDNDY